MQRWYAGALACWLLPVVLVAAGCSRLPALPSKAPSPESDVTLLSCEHHTYTNASLTWEAFSANLAIHNSTRLTRGYAMTVAVVDAGSAQLVELKAWSIVIQPGDDATIMAGGNTLDLLPAGAKIACTVTGVKRSWETW